MKTAKIIASFFGAGYLPVAPGTFGALAGFLVSYLISFFISDHYMFHSIHVFLILSAYFAGVYAAKKLESEWGHDPSRIVIDETLGFWISILFLPANVYIFLTAFVFFRFFDILKPLGIRSIDRLKTHHSVMLDDVLAGVYSNIVLKMALYFLKIDIS